MRGSSKVPWVPGVPGVLVLEMNMGTGTYYMYTHYTRVHTTHIIYRYNTAKPCWLVQDFEIAWIDLTVHVNVSIDPLPQRIFELFGQQNPKLDFQNSRLYLGRTLTLCFVKIKILPKQWLIVQCMYAMYTSC